MKKLAFLATVVVMLALMSGVAYAESPHGPYADNTALCAACHRTHTAVSDYLLSSAGVTGICIECHEAGRGADTDVVNGTYIAGDEAGGGEGSGYGDYTKHDQWGADNGVLMGGGFEGIGTGVGSTTTSKHFDVDSRHLVLGYTLGTDPAPGSDIDQQETGHMDCVDCHIPHASTNYRMLRLRPNGAIADINVADNLVTDGSHKYTETANTGDTTGLFNIAEPDLVGNEGISAWCAACHTYYFEGQATDNDGSGVGDVPRATPFTETYWDTDNDGVAEPTYMHAVDADLMYKPRSGGDAVDLSANLGTNVTYPNKLPVAATGGSTYDENDLVTCLTCHRAHGTNATTSSYAALPRTLESPDIGGVAQPDVVISGANASVLLRLPDRAVCETCHDMSGF